MSETKWAVIQGYSGRYVFTVETDEAWAFKQVGYKTVAVDLSKEEAKALCKLLEEPNHGNR